MASKGTRGTTVDFGGYEISVSMVKATQSVDIKTEYVLDKLDEKTGEVKPVTVTMSGGSGGGSRTPAEGVYKAVRLSESHVLALPPDALEAISENSKAEHETMRVLETIDIRQVPIERITGTYYLQPRNGTGSGCRMLWEGLRETDLCAIVKWIGTSREKLGILRARVVGGRPVLHLSELSFSHDTLVPDDDIALDDIEVSEQAREAAKTLVEGFRRERGGERAVDTAVDTAVMGRIALVEQLQEAELERALGAVPAPAEAQESAVSA